MTIFESCKDRRIMADRGVLFGKGKFGRVYVSGCVATKVVDDPDYANTNNKPTHAMTASLCRQLYAGHAYLHDNQISQCDVGANNVLVFSTDPLVVKLADFGTSCKISYAPSECCARFVYRTEKCMSTTGVCNRWMCDVHGTMCCALLLWTFNKLPWYNVPIVSGVVSELTSSELPSAVSDYKFEVLAAYQEWLRTKNDMLLILGCDTRFIEFCDLVCDPARTPTSAKCVEFWVED